MSVTPFPMVAEMGANVELRGRWIAPPGKTPDNYTFLARKEFTVRDVPARAVLRVAADSRYVLYLNGKYVGMGPAKGSHKRYFFDSYEIAAALKPGKNFLAAEVHCPVRATYLAAPFAPAFWAQLEGIVETDASWQARRDPSCRPDALIYTQQMGFSDYRDLRKEIKGWQTFRDSPTGWARAKVLSRTTELGGRVLAPRDIGPLTSDPFRPKAVCGTGTVPPEPANTGTENDYAALMQSELHFEADLPRFEDLDALSTGGSARLLPSLSGRGAYCFLDFKRELMGSVILDIEAPEGTVLDLGFSEALYGGRMNVLRFAYRFADRYVLRGGRQRIEHRLHDRGLRILQMVFRRFQKPVKIHSVELVNHAYPIPAEGTFECDQLFFNRLWDMARHTIQVCSSDTFMDCPWREQALWLNDTLVETSFFLTISSDRAFVRRNLRLGADGALPNGLIPAVYPSGRKCLFPSMSALWTIVLSDYFLYTADLELVRELLPVMDKALSVYDGWREKDGLVPNQKGMWNFIDWGYSADTAAPDGKTAILNVLIAAALKRAAGLHEAAGNPERAEGLRRLSRSTMAAVTRKFWMPKRARFNDSTDPFQGRHTVSQHPHGVALFFGLLDKAQEQGALDALTDPSVVPAELYFQHFGINSLAHAGRAQQAMDLIRRLWGAMIEQDSPTVWETVRGRDAFSGCGSLCHGFACTPLYFMHNTLLGVQALKPGFAEFRLAPQGLGLLWAKGNVPTPHGVIRVNWARQADQALVIDVDVPDGATAILPDSRRLGPGRHIVS